MIRTGLFIFLITCNLTVLANPVPPAEKVLLLQLESSGLIRVGRDTVSTENIARYLQNRLFKSYMGTGRMQDRIRLEKSDPDIPEMVVEVVLTEIRAGQQRALRELCMQKYRRYFEDLDNKKKMKLQRDYPVLFQSDYSG